MFVGLVDALRCIRPHEENPLVAASFRTEDRDILEGELGCPVCGARYPVRRGVVEFDVDARDAVSTDRDAAGDDDERALRIAALLDLISPGGLAVLVGAWTGVAHEVAALADRVHVLGLDPAPDIGTGLGVSLARTGSGGIVPLRPRWARGVALDAAHAGGGYVASAVAALRPGGRLVVPASVAVPAGVTELARDADLWVGVRDAPRGPLTPIAGRARR